MYISAKFITGLFITFILFQCNEQPSKMPHASKITDWQHCAFCPQANTFHVPQIDVPPKSADLAIDAAIPDRAFSYGAIVDNSSDNQSLEIGEILGEIFGQSPDRSACH